MTLYYLEYDREARPGATRSVANGQKLTLLDEVEENRTGTYKRRIDLVGKILGGEIVVSQGWTELKEDPEKTGLSETTFAVGWLGVRHFDRLAVAGSKFALGLDARKKI